MSGARSAPELARLTLLVLGLVGPCPASSRSSRLPHGAVRNGTGRGGSERNRNLPVGIFDRTEIPRNGILSGSELFGTGLCGPGFFGTEYFQNGNVSERGFFGTEYSLNGILRNGIFIGTESKFKFGTV